MHRRTRDRLKTAAIALLTLLVVAVYTESVDRQRHACERANLTRQLISQDREALNALALEVPSRTAGAGAFPLPPIPTVDCEDAVPYWPWQSVRDVNDAYREEVEAGDG